ncbi:glycosyltransferase [Candidatus Litorirhabdus singularis]|uniref:glycosyltransferase n=1 Tax=Candidatus Litorirhabdus singularis TaxID=2518993 RepID=UPI002431EBBA|nr:glycosyltransferase [Candidatus Litorirhabdus singularis]
MNNSLTVIVPVYSGLEIVKACLESVQQSVCESAHELLVIYDAGPEPDLEAYLEELDRTTDIQLHKNQQNLGFVKTVNLGFQLAGSSDCIILNSDTLVPDGWIDRMLFLAERDATIATITPFTNNGEICSFPNFCQDNDLPWGMSHKSMDRIFRDTMPADAVDIPTGVGFCMYLRREALDKVGSFDAKRFGRGYGEENDFCRRAAESGFRNVLCTNLFVFHSGGESFGTEKKQLMEKAADIMLARHPNYGVLVTQFIGRDPLKAYRFQAALSLLQHCDEPVVLVLNHGMGGGANKYINDLRQFYQRNAHFVVIEPGDRGDWIITLPQWLQGLQLSLDVDKEEELLFSIIQSIKPNFTLVNHIKGLETQVQNLLRVADSEYALILHDYYLISANPTLTDSEGRFSPERMTKSALFKKDIIAGSGLSVVEWRALCDSLFENASFVIAPSNSVRDIFEKHYPGYCVEVRNHLDAELIGCYPPVQIRSIFEHSPVRVGILGALGKEKGADILESVAEKARRQGLAIEFYLVGFAYRPLSSAVVTHGVYQETQLKGLLDNFKPNFIWYPCLCSETYCFTLSTVMEMGLPVMVTDIGALQERTRGRPFTKVVPYQSTVDEWLLEIKTFAEEIRSDSGAVKVWEQQQKVPPYYSGEFYEIIKNASRSGKNTEMPSIDSIEALLEKNVPRGVGLKAKIYQLLIKLRMHPRLAWVSVVMPYSLQKKIKRMLSRKSVHEY